VKLSINVSRKNQKRPEKVQKMFNLCSIFIYDIYFVYSSNIYI